MIPLRSPFPAENFSPNDATRLAGVLKALADPTRVQILNALDQHGEMTVTDLTSQLDRQTQCTISVHVRILEAAGLLQHRQDRSRRPRFLDYAALAEVGQLLHPQPDRRQPS